MFRPYSLAIMLLIVAPVGGQTTQPSRLVLAIEQVESGGDVNAVGDNGRAVGCLQIHPVTVRECNRILGRQEFSMADRSSRARSFEMFRVIAGQSRGASDEVIARRWNGGPTGERKAATRGYWVRVKREMER